MKTGMIKRVVTIIVVLCLAFTALTAGAFADSTPTTGPLWHYYSPEDAVNAHIFLENSSDQCITAFYLAYACDSDWGTDLLDGYYLPSGYYSCLDHSVRFAPGVLFQTCIVLRDGSIVETDSFDLASMLNTPSIAYFVLDGENGDYCISIG